MPNRIPTEVLLIEDNPGDVRLATEALRRTNVCKRHVLKAVANGSRALDLLRRRRCDGDRLPDLILLDLNLPGRHGREVLRELKKDPVLGAIPVVVFTSSGDEADIAEVYQLQSNCFVTKPSDVDRYINTIRSIVDFWVRKPHCACGH